MEHNSNGFSGPSYDGKGEIAIPPQYLQIPRTLSNQAKRWLGDLYQQLYGVASEKLDSTTTNTSFQASRFISFVDSVKQKFIEKERQLISDGSVKIERGQVFGVDVDIITPTKSSGAFNKREKCILHLTDSDTLLGLRSLTTAMLLAMNIEAKVVVPDISFKESSTKRRTLEKLLLLYQSLQDEASPANFVLSGESLGADLCISLLVLAYQQRLKSPQGVGLLGLGKLAGDWYFHNRYLDVTNLASIAALAFDKNDFHFETDDVDPVINPLQANLEILPPCIILTSTRDRNFSGSTIYHREMKRAGVEAKLYAVDGLPHYFHLNTGMPESIEYYQQLFDFIRSRLASAI